MLPGSVQRKHLAAMIFLQSVPIAADSALILHQNNTVLPRADHIWVKETPHAIPNPRLHGMASGANRKDAFGVGDSSGNQGCSRPFPLAPIYIAGANECAACYTKLLDFHLTAKMDAPALIFEEPHTTKWGEKRISLKSDNLAGSSSNPRTIRIRFLPAANPASPNAGPRRSRSAYECRTCRHRIPTRAGQAKVERNIAMTIESCSINCVDLKFFRRF